MPRPPSVLSILPTAKIKHHHLADSKFTSFQRQLNLYQFKRRKGAHAGAFHHPSFRRGQRHLLSKVRRQKVKRDLAVEARAAQRLARAKGGGGGGDNSASQLSGRGRTRGAAQGDLRPIRRQRQIDDDDVSDDDEEFDAAPGSRRSALRRRVDGGPGRYAQDGGGGDESSTDGSWQAGNNLERFSSGDDDDRLDWGEHGRGDANYNSNTNNWRQQVPGSPERSSMELHHVSTPMTMTSQSEYEHSPNGSGLGRTSSVGSSMASSLSFASSPSHSEMMFHSSSPYQLNDCDDSGLSDATSNQHSPMSIHSPLDPAAATVQAAANQVSPAQQQHSNDLSLAAVVDASINGWSSPHQSSSLLHLEQFGWGAANISADAAAPWSDPSSAGVPHHHQSSQSSPHSHEDFGFIDLFAANWDPNEGSSSSSSSSSSMDSGAMTSSSSSSSSSDNNIGGDGRNGAAAADDDDAFLKEAQAAGVFGGVEDFLVPRNGIGATAGYGGPGDFA